MPLIETKYAIRVVIDFMLLLTVLVTLLVVRETWVAPERGFFCQDTSIRYPYAADSISRTQLLLVGCAGPIGSMIVLEYLRCRNGEVGKRLLLCGFNFPAYVWNIYSSIGVFLFGCACSQLLTDVAKYSIGRLRPHFIAICNPDWSLINCEGEPTAYIYPVCNPEDDFRLKEARLSFPSGHSSFSAFTMVYLVLYLQGRMHCRIRLVRPFIQFVCLLIAFYTSLSRVSDYKHHWSDALFGSLLGASVAISVWSNVWQVRVCCTSGIGNASVGCDWLPLAEQSAPVTPTTTTTTTTGSSSVFMKALKQAAFHPSAVTGGQNNNDSSASVDARNVEVFSVRKSMTSGSDEQQQQHEQVHLHQLRHQQLNQREGRLCQYESNLPYMQMMQQQHQPRCQHQPPLQLQNNQILMQQTHQQLHSLQQNQHQQRSLQLLQHDQQPQLQQAEQQQQSLHQNSTTKPTTSNSSSHQIDQRQELEKCSSNAVPENPQQPPIAQDPAMATMGCSEAYGWGGYLLHETPPHSYPSNNTVAINNGDDRPHFNCQVTTCYNQCVTSSYTNVLNVNNNTVTCSNKLVDINKRIFSGTKNQLTTSYSLLLPSAGQVSNDNSQKTDNCGQVDVSDCQLTQSYRTAITTANSLASLNSSQEAADNDQVTSSNFQLVTKTNQLLPENSKATASNTEVAASERRQVQFNNNQKSTSSSKLSDNNIQIKSNDCQVTYIGNQVSTGTGQVTAFSEQDISCNKPEIICNKEGGVSNEQVITSSEMSTGRDVSLAGEECSSTMRAVISVPNVRTITRYRGPVYL